MAHTTHEEAEMSGFQNLYTDEEAKTIMELQALSKKLRNKYFSLGTDLDKFMKLIGKIENKNVTQACPRP